jgi:Ca2+-binding RTX toxin-like protein
MTGAGSEFVIFGHAGGFSASIDLATLDGTNGFRIDGSSPYEQAGQISSSAGDINDDGFSDILIGAPTLPNNDPDDHNGQAFVLYGRAPLAAVSLTGTDAGQTLAGGAFDDDLRGRHGADSLYGNGGNDTLYGGDGNDVLKGGAGDDALRGNAGSDTAAYDQATGSVHVDLSVSRAQHVGGGQGIDTLVSIENLSGSNFSDRLTGDAGANTLTGLHGNDHLTGGLGADTLNGGAGRDTYVYDGVTDSTGRVYDTILGLNTNHDLIDLPQTVAGVDKAIASGHLDAAHINAGLVTAIGAAQLGAFDAVLFTPDSGTLAGKTFLIIDANGTAGYQADADYVIQLDGAAHLDALSAANFI